MKVSGYAVQAADTTNEPPKFADQDDLTPKETRPT